MAVTKVEKLERGRRTSGVRTLPEGGWGWMIVVACFFTTICTRAVTRCVSIFFMEFQLHFEKDYSTTAWIQSLIDCNTMLYAPLSSFLGNRLSCRATLILGGLLSFSGLVLSSLASSLEHLYIFMGILTGLGFALCYTPAVAMVGRYFSERKALAYGIALSGTGIGTFILAPTVQVLIEHYSWRGALLILGGFALNLCVCGALMRPPVPRGGETILENNMVNLERDCMTTLLDSKDTEEVSADCSQVEPKQLEINNLEETEGVLITNGALKNVVLENERVDQGRIVLLSSLPDPSLTDLKISECTLFSNKLTETMLGKLKLSDPKLQNGSTIEDLKLVESMNLKNAADMDARIEDSGLTETNPTDAYHLYETVNPPQEPLVSTNTLSKGRRLCLKFREEFGFLMLPDFFILSVSFLFMAYGSSAPIVYLVPYALSVGVGHKQAAFVMSICGVSSIVGNISVGWITDRKCLKRYRLLFNLVIVGTEGLCCMIIPLLHSFAPLVLSSAIYGYLEGGFVSLIPVVTSDVVGPTYLTSALGVVYFLHGIPYLVSPPTGGWLVDRTGNYAATFFLSGASLMFSSLVLAAFMVVKRCRRSKSTRRCTFRFQ